jgi:hypothetical protein
MSLLKRSHNRYEGRVCVHLKGLHNHPRIFGEAARINVGVLSITKEIPMRMKVDSLDQPEEFAWDVDG